MSVSEAIPTTKWQYKTHWEDNKLYITVIWLALGQVLSRVLWWDLHLGSGMSPPASQPYCHQQPEMQDALALVTAEQDRK